VKFAIQYFISQMLNNPLIISILNILKDTDKFISLYQLMKILEKSGYDLIRCSADESNEVKIFRKNFIVMNALYELNSDLSGSGYRLYISSLKIQLLVDGNGLTSEDQAVEASLSKYYLDWNNFHGTDNEDVEALLKSFWVSYKNYNQLTYGNDKRLDSLDVLGLESSASWKDIQQAYRQLIKIYHPDKGGNSLKFIQVRKAFLILKLTHDVSH